MSLTEKGNPDGRDAKLIQLPNANVKLLPRDQPRIVEIATTGFDENLQLVGSDPFGGSSWTGLRVPTLPTPDTNHRYLMMLASFSLGERAKARIVGYRQLVTLGFKQATGGAGSPQYVVEQLVETPTFHLSDGGVSFHIQQLGPPNNQGFAPTDQGPNDVRNFKFRWCETPAVLYQKATLIDPFYVNLTAYTPPNLGRPWGRPLRNGGQNSFVDLRTQWETHGAWTSLNIPLDGPDTIALFASVRQSNPTTRPKLTLPGTFFPRGLSREELFIQNFPNAIYWRVAGSLIVELG